MRTKIGAVLMTLGLAIAGLIVTAPTASAAADNFHWPVTGNIPSADVAWHRANENGARAVDIAAGLNSPVGAAQSGVVVTVSKACADSNSWGCGGGFGNYVIVRHDRVGVANPLYSLYAHLGSTSIPVAVGSAVNTGTRLGSVALSGSTTGPHTHFAIATCGRPWSTGPADYNTNCTIWNGPDTAMSGAAGSPMPGSYSQLVSPNPTNPSVPSRTMRAIWRFSCQTSL